MCPTSAVSTNWMSDVILPFVHRSQNSVTADLPVGLNVPFARQWIVARSLSTVSESIF